MDGKDYLFTSESVTEGHPDKLADQISDSILDAILTNGGDSYVVGEGLGSGPIRVVLVPGHHTAVAFRRSCSRSSASRMTGPGRVGSS